MTDPSPAVGVLTQFVERAQRLYSLPAVAMKVVELTDSPRIDAQALKECVEQDPALTAKILRVVNSALFSLRREVGDVGQAIALLGARPLKLLVLSFSLPPKLFAGLTGEALASYWRHAILKSVSAREISGQLWGRSGDDAFIAGLLQDVGSLALIQELGDDYVVFLQQARHQRRDLAELEVEALGFPHAAFSARLLDSWRLPEAIVRAVGEPQDVERLEQLPADQGALPQILHLAELLAQLLLQGDPRFLRRLLDAGQRYRQISLESWRRLITAIEGKSAELAEALAVKLPPGVSYGDILESAHQQLAEVGIEAAEAILTGSASRSFPPLELVAQRGAPPSIGSGLGLDFTAGAVEAAPPAREAAPPWRGLAPGTSAKTSLPPVDDCDPALLGRLAVSLRTCRQQRSPLSLALAEIDRPDELLLLVGADGCRRLWRMVELAVSELGQPQGAWQVRDGRFACVIEGQPRARAVEQARLLLQALRQWGERSGSSHGAAPTVSVGVAGLALPPRDFPPAALVEAAERCLYAAQAAGGDGVRSIELH